MFSFHEVLKFVKDMVFPLFCLSCKREGAIVCSNCLKKLPKTGQAVCPVFDTSQKKYLASHTAVFPYQEGELLSKLLFAWKYDGIREAESVLFSCLQDFFSFQKNFFAQMDLIVPVPLHKKRSASRGFNQAEVLSEFLSSGCHVRVSSHLLVRTRDTKQQAKLGKHERQKNVVGAFALTDTGPVRGKKILLVDDVFTTGATMNECARVLQAGGVGEVHGFTFAHGSFVLSQK